MTVTEALATLELDEPATLADVKQAHKDLALMWHPDRAPNERLKTRANAKLKALNNARDVLVKHLKTPSPADRPRSKAKPTPASSPKPQESAFRPMPTNWFGLQARKWRGREGPFDSMSIDHAVFRGPGDGQIVAVSRTSPMEFIKACYAMAPIRWVTTLVVRDTVWLTVMSRWSTIENQEIRLQSTGEKRLATIKKHFSRGFDIGPYTERADGGGGIVFNKGTGLGSENIRLFNAWPTDALRTSRIEQNEALVGVGTVGSQWRLHTAQVSGWGGQRISRRDSWETMVAACKQCWDEERKVTSIAFMDGTYVIVGTRGTDLGQQALQHYDSVEALREGLEKYWKLGRVVTAACPDHLGWWLVFSRHPTMG
jgi:hypothetical protein